MMIFSERIRQILGEKEVRVLQIGVEPTTYRLELRKLYH